VEKVIHNSPETKAIRQRMEEMRYDLDEDVQEIVEDARDMGDWRYYVRTYPWVCLGVAWAFGYFLVPRRPFGMQPDAQALAELANQSRLLAVSHFPSNGTARSMLLAFVGHVLLRAVHRMSDYMAANSLPSVPPNHNSTINHEENHIPILRGENE